MMPISDFTNECNKRALDAVHGVGWRTWEQPIDPEPGTVVVNLSEETNAWNKFALEEAEKRKECPRSSSG